MTSLLAKTRAIRQIGSQLRIQYDTIQKEPDFQIRFTEPATHCRPGDFHYFASSALGLIVFTMRPYLPPYISRGLGTGNFPLQNSTKRR